MNFPLSFWDISLWLAVTSIILLVTSEIITPRYRKTYTLVNKKRLRSITFVMSSLFLMTVVIRIYQILQSA